MFFGIAFNRFSVRPVPCLVVLLTSVALVAGGMSGSASADDDTHSVTSSPASKDGGDSDDDGDLDSPDAVSASVMAKLRKKPVEDLSQRSETSRTFAEKNGTWTTTQSAAPVRVLKDGAWVGVDYSLVHQPDGSWAPKASPTDVAIDGSGGKEAARVTFDSGDTLAVTWPEALPEPSVEGAVATYSLSQSTDLIVTATGGGVDAHIRLNQAPQESDPVFTLGLRSDGVDVDKSGAGLKITADDGKTIAKTSPLVAWDADTDDAGSPADIVPLTSTLEEVTAKDDVTAQQLSLTAPDGYLTDPSTHYPVIIDPSIRDLTPLRDTWVRNGDAANHSGEGHLVVGKINGSSNTNPAQSFVKFNTNQLAGTKVGSATLKLWQTYAYTCANRNMNLQPVTTNWSDNMTWATRGTATSSYSTSIAQNRGQLGCDPGWSSADVTGMAAQWAGGWTNEGIRLGVASTDEGQSSFERRFCSIECSNPDKIPTLTVNYSRPPDKPQVPHVEDGGGMWRGSTFYANSTTPVVSTGSNDPDDDPDDLSYYIGARYVNGGASIGWGDTGCYTPWVESGAWSRCQITSKISDGATYELRALAHDGPFGVTASTSWSDPSLITIDATSPVAPSVSCTGGYANNSWVENRGAASVTCTATSSNAYDMIWNKNRSGTPTVVAGNTVTKEFAVPETGTLVADFTGRSRSGLTTTSTFAIGVGTASILPVEEERTSTTVPMKAQSAKGAVSAKLQWRSAGTDTWTDAKKTGTAFDHVRLSTGAAWTGAVSQTPTTSMVDLVWSPHDEPGLKAPSHVESRVVFDYNGITRETPARSVQVVPHAFGGSFPTQALGPGQVGLFTGEFQLSETDVDVPAYSGSLTLGRSHLSLGGATTDAAGVFGPGWSADFSGPDYGVASYIVDDRRATDGSIYVTSPDGESYGYGKDDGSVGANVTGRFNGLGEYAVDEDHLSVNAAGTELSMTEADGTVTRFTKPGDTWLAQEVVSAEAGSTVTYAYDGNRVSWIFAPKPGGVASCTTTSQSAGCRALELVYTIGGDTRLDHVNLHIWDPKPASDGTPGASAAMTTVTVAKYAYADGKLTEAWDPRLDTTAGGDTASLKTKYTYATVGGKVVVKTVQPPGLKTWTINYDDKSRVKTITRAQDDDVAGSGVATWTVQYDLALTENGDGLPNLSPASTATWGQLEADAPSGGAAVFGPDQVPGGSPTASEYEYADLSYWTTVGRTTNTAAYGAGAWQVDSTRYDDKGNPVWQLSPAGKAEVLARRTANPGDGQGEVVRSAASAYATLTVYSTGDERRVTATYGPMSMVQLADAPASAAMISARKLTRTTYDDTSDSGLKPGYPTADVPVGGFGLPVRTTEVATTGVFPYEEASANKPSEADLHITLMQYSPVESGDGDGWKLGIPTRVGVQSSSNSFVVTMTRFDTEGKVIETRTPQGNETTYGSANDARSTRTTYYTPGTNSIDPSCGGKPEWAGLVCTTGQGGGQAPTTRIAGYSMLLAPTRTEETHDGAIRASVTSYDPAGRAVTASTTTSGPGIADRAVPATTTAYSSSTGAVTSVSAEDKTQSTTYDSWGRVRTATDGEGATATTTYDVAGRVKSKSDGKGTYTYAYNGTDSRGKAERRGLITDVDVGKPSELGSGTPTTFTGAYDGSGALVEQNYPGGVKATWVRNINGVETGLAYTKDQFTLISYANQVDVDGRVINQFGPDMTQQFTYDKRGRLTQVRDARGGQCTVRKYGFSADSDRESLQTFAPGTGGVCQTDTGATVATSFDSTDRLNTDTYDKLGRTTDLNTGSGGAATIGYHANDMVATITQGTKKQDYSLDLSGRASTVQDLTSSVSLREATNHYDGGGDSPAWTAVKTRADATTPWTEGWNRNVADLNGDLGLIQTSTGDTRLELANLHGDIAATLVLGSTPTFAMSPAVDEYGKPLTAAMNVRYGWLGAKQRDGAATTGLTLMGARLYNPVTGRFLSRDPVAGGNENSYTYPGDPVNEFDTSGRSGYGKYKANKKEIAVCAKHPTKCKAIRNWSKKVLNSLRDSTDSTRINFIRHTVWQLGLCKIGGCGMAEELGNAHESDSPDPRDSAYDQANNAWARKQFMGNPKRFSAMSYGRMVRFATREWNNRQRPRG